MKNKILSNILSLLSIRSADYILGFMTLPLLTHALGVERFGAMSFARSFSTYFLLIVTYAFNLTGPRDIAMCRNDKERGECFSEIFFSKLLLCACSSLIYFSLVFWINDFYTDRLLYIASFLFVLGDLVYPIWFFQGLEKMKYLSYISISSRLLTLVLIMKLIHGPEDTAMAIVFQASTTFIGALTSFCILWKKYRYVFVFTSFARILNKLKDGWHLFYATIATNIYTGSNVFLLGILTDNTTVGYFTAAQKLLIAAKSVVDTIASAIYPHTSMLVAKSHNEAIIFLSKWLKRLIVIGGGISLIGFSFSGEIINLIIGKGYNDSIAILRIIIFIPFIVSFTNIYLIQTLVIFGYTKLYSRIVTYSATFNMIFIFPFIYFLQGIGVSILMVLTELLVALLAIACVRKKNIYFTKYKF